MSNFVTFLTEQTEKKAVNLIAEIGRIMRNLDLANNKHEVTDPRSYTFHDLIEALTIVNDVVAARSKEPADQYNADREQGYAQLFDSIQEEIKEAIKMYFSVPGARSARFIPMFNSLVVEKIVECLKQADPKEMKKLCDVICKQGKAAVMDTVDGDADEAQHELDRYNEARKKQLRDKPAASMFDRVAIKGSLS